MSFCNKADKEWQTNWPLENEGKWDKDGWKLFTNIEKDVRGGWLGQKEVWDGSFIIAMAAFIGVLKMCKLKLTCEI